MKKLVTIFLVAQAIDCFFTMWATNNGFVEVNPLMAPFAHTWDFVFFKVTIPALIVAAIVLVTKKFPAVYSFTFGFLLSANAITVGVVIWNAIEIVKVV